MFSSLGAKNKKILADNFIYSRTRQLTFLTDISLVYNFSKPLMANFADYGIVKDLGKIADINNLKTKDLLTDFKASKKTRLSFILAKNKPYLVPKYKTKAKQIILALSFGKDSLLSYGLVRELGLNCQIVFVKEMENLNSVEAKFKKQIIKKFIKNEKVQIDYLYDNADEIFLSKKLIKKIHEFDNTNGMLAFILELLPLAYYYSAKYVILGNEANFTDAFINHNGYKSYPSFDQSIIYAKKHNQYLQRLTKNNLQSVSLVEPIYNLAEMHILYHRYPNLLKYLMSCSPKKTNSEKWCYECPMCAKAFLYSKAIGGDPKKISFNRNFFAKQYIEFFPLFSAKNTRAYEKPKAVRDEQLLAFFLAYRNGCSGDLIDLFAKKYLKEAIKREKILRGKFFGIHPSTTIPKQFKNKLFNIYQQELKGLL
ncbi:MAG: hypothetical protein Q8O32_01405 [bacterium]|nr:hypothetical protein [bacterium]